MRVTGPVVLAVCAVVFVIMVLPLKNTLVDDTYIHLQYARNLSEAGELSFNRGDPTYGATSPLFVFILSVVHQLGGELLVWCRILSWIFALLTIVLVYRFVLLLEGRHLVAGMAALVMACEAWLLRWSAVGMETSFAVFMILTVLILSFTSCRSVGRSILFGIVLFLAVLARPEAMLLIPLAIIAFSFARGSKICARFVWLLVFLPLFVLWLYVVHRHTGSLFPLTAGAKQGNFIFSLMLFRRALIPIKIMGATVGVPWIFVIAGLIIGAAKYRYIFAFFDPHERGTGDAPRRDGAADIHAADEHAARPGPGSETEHVRGPAAAGLMLTMLWIFALPFAYVVFDFQVLSRYLLPVSPAVIVLGSTALWRLSSRLLTSPVMKTAAAAAFTAVVIAQNAFFYAIVVVPPTREFSDGMKEVLVGMGEWLRGNTDEDVIVATPDIGAIGYVSERRVLDLGGLVTPEINRMRRRIDFEEIVEQGFYLNFRADFLVDRSTDPARFAGKIIRGVKFTTVMQGIIPNLGIRQPDPVHYVLYRLTGAQVRVEGED